MDSIAILYASEGTGHRTAAEALRDRFLIDHPNGRVVCRDVLDYTPWLLHNIVSDGYLFMARHTPWAWGWFYWGSDKPSFQARSFDCIHDFLCRFYLSAIEADLYRHGVEAVFFTHYFAAANLARRNLDKFPVFYVNTDFVCHRFQRDAVFRESFCASPIAVRQHHDDKISRVVDSGIPIAPKYGYMPSKENARAKLGLTSEDKVVLISGGGIGAGAVTEAAASFAERSDITPVVICGNNRGLFDKLTRMYGGGEMRIEGFVPNMEDYYAAADLGIMKPGGLSLSEAFAAELPLFLIDPIPGQEQLNMDYVCDLGAAFELRSVKCAADRAAMLLGDEARLAEVRANIKKISRPDAAGDILRIAESCIDEDRRR